MFDAATTSRIPFQFSSWPVHTPQEALKLLSGSGLNKEITFSGRYGIVKATTGTMPGRH
ncbi:MAG: hypothetical protein P0107_02010 [Nitrosomonas sp.]|nr:hypothetical protein [Nitrosomonas sp.]